MSKVNIKSPTSESAQASHKAARYSTVAIVLHWLLGISIFAMFAIGIYMSDLPFSPLRLKLYNYHKWAGITFLILSVLRLLWRLVNRPPALPKTITQAMPSWQTKAYHGSHYALYALFFAVPTDWLGLQLGGWLSDCAVWRVAIA